MPSPEEIKKAEDSLKKINAIYRELGKKKLNLVDVKSLEEIPDILSTARTELENVEGTAASLYGQLKGVTAELKGQGTAIGQSRKGYRDITKIASTLASDEKEISQLNIKQLQALKKKAALAKGLIEEGAKELIANNSAVKLIEDEVALLVEAKNTEESINAFRTDAILKSKQLNDEEKAILLAKYDERDIAQEILDKTQERLEFEKKIEKQTSGFSTLSKIVKSIPGLSGLSEPFEKAAAAAKEAAREGKGGLASFSAGGKALLKAFGPVVMITAAFKFLKDVAFAVDSKQTSIAKSMSLSASEAKAQYKTVKGIKNSTDDIFVSTKNLVKAQGELGASMGATRGFTADQLKDQVAMVDKMGIQVETAGKLQALSMAGGQTADKSLDSIISATQALKLQTGIQLDQKGVIDEVAKADGQLAANYANSPKLIAKAVLQTRKLGLNLKQAASMASGLLDFESSISKEMEAEMLIGRDLNLDKARQLALQGDAAGAAAAMRKEVGSLAEFQELNVIQQQALAGAVNMTADELANSMMQEENLAKLGANTRKEIEERVKLLKSQGKVEEANRLLSQTGNAEDAKAALERVTIQQEFQQALNVAKETFSEIMDSNLDIAGTAQSIVGFFSSLSKNLGTIKVIAAVIGGIFTAMAISSALTAIASIATMSAATLGIGIVATIAGIAAGASMLNSTSNSAATTTRTAAKNDVAIPAGYGNNMISGPKGSIALNNSDSIIAGTDLFGGSGTNNNSSTSDKLLKKLDKLIEIVERGGNVYMDGSKVGEALVLSSNLSS
jgi:hypothetical protein